MEKVKEAAAERVALVGAAGVRGPREREDCLLLSLRLLRGALGETPPFSGAAVP